MRRRRLSVKLESNMGKCIVEREMSQRTETNSTTKAFHIFSTLQLCEVSSREHCAHKMEKMLFGAFYLLFLAAKKLYFTQIYFTLHPSGVLYVVVCY